MPYVSVKYTQIGKGMAVGEAALWKLQMPLLRELPPGAKSVDTHGVGMV